jgi:hypothetical protein
MFFNMKAMLGLVLAVFIFYQIGCETVWKNALAEVTAKEAKQKELLQTREADRQRTNDLYALEQQVLTLPVALASVPAGSSPRVKAVSILDNLKQALLQAGSALVEEAPQNSTSTAIDEAPLPPVANPKHAAKVTLVSLLAKDPIQVSLIGDSVPAPLKVSLPNQTLPPMPAWNYPFTLTVKGDVLNVLKLVNVVAAHNPLIVINKLELKRDTSTDDATEAAFIKLPKGSSTPTQGPTALNQLPAQLMAAVFNKATLQALTPTSVAPEPLPPQAKATTPSATPPPPKSPPPPSPVAEVSAPPPVGWQQMALVTLQLELFVFIIDPALGQ